jgi:hypothetical protein
VQEAFVGPFPLVVCGDKRVEWQHFMRILTKLQESHLAKGVKEHGLSIGGHLMFVYLHWSTRDESEVNLETLLHATTNRLATDPRDHVYALLGMVTDPDFERVEVDYGKPARLAYQHAMVSVLKSRKDIDWLVYAVGGSGDVPSWCFEFSKRDWSEGRSDNRTAVWPVYKNPSLQFELEHNPLEGTMKVAGVDIDTIDRVFVPKVDGVNEMVAGWMATKEDLDEEEVTALRDAAAAKIAEYIIGFTATAWEALERRVGAEKAEQKVHDGDV